MLILLQKENEQDQAHKVHDTFFKRFQIHQLAMMHRFIRTDHDILLNYLFSILYRLCM